jgi:hypothetical protein
VQKPKKYVLVRAASFGELFVLERVKFKELTALGIHKTAEVVAESDDRAELVRFRALTEEN